MTNNKIKLVVLGDIHIGSLYGLCPPNEISESKKTIFHSWVWDRWNEFCEKHKNPDYLILIGDIIDGNQSIDKGVNSITTSITEQTKIASEVLKMIIGENTKVYGVCGSNYHIGSKGGVNGDKQVIDMIAGEYKGTKFEFDIGGHRIQLQHKVSGGIVNVATGLQRELKLARENSVKCRKICPNILIRAHRHVAYHIHDDCGMIGILNGCWQYTTPFMENMSSNISPNIGATIIELENGTPKVYREEYNIPEEVIDEMAGYEELKSDSDKIAERAENLKKILASR